MEILTSSLQCPSKWRRHTAISQLLWSCSENDSAILLIGSFGTGGVCHLAACLWSHFWSYSVFAVFRVTHWPGEPMNTSWPPGVPACCCMCLINAHRENMRKYLLTVAHFNSCLMLWQHDSSKLLLPEETVWAQKREKNSFHLDQWNGFNLLSSVWCTVPVFHCLSFCPLLCVFNV